MKVKAYNIMWATDFHDRELLNLPSEAGLVLEFGEDPDEEIPEALFELYGWPVDHFDYELWDA